MKKDFVLTTEEDREAFLNYVATSELAGIQLNAQVTYDGDTFRSGKLKEIAELPPRYGLCIRVLSVSFGRSRIKSFPIYFVNRVVLRKAKSSGKVRLAQ